MPKLNFTDVIANLEEIRSIEEARKFLDPYKKAELQEIAQELKIKLRSNLTKDQIIHKLYNYFSMPRIYREMKNRPND